MNFQSRNVCVALPNQNQVTMTVGGNHTGQEVINQLSELLGIKKLYPFGLCLEKENELLFLDSKKRLTSYFPKAWKQNTLPEQIVLYLKVQHYVGNEHLIVDEKARGLYYADLKGRVMSSQCYEQEGHFFQLAAYALQVDLGDWRETEEPYFKPQHYFPPWIILKRGCDYVARYTPELHRELMGTSALDATLLFIQEACNLFDVPLTFYSMSKEKKEQTGSVLIGLTLTGLHVYEMVHGERQLLNELLWSSIERLSFKGRRFEIEADVLAGTKLVLYTRSALHARHLLKHMGRSHHVHLSTKQSVTELQLQQKRAEGKRFREMYVRHSTDPDPEEDSEDELPPLMSYLEEVKRRQGYNTEAISELSNDQNACGIPRRQQDVTSADSYETEMCVDEPEGMFVDDPDENICFTELLEGVSVDGPLFMPMSQWINVTMEMKQVLKWRACSLSIDQYTERVDDIQLSNTLNSLKENKEEEVATI